MLIVGITSGGYSAQHPLIPSTTVSFQWRKVADESALGKCISSISIIYYIAYSGSPFCTVCVRALVYTCIQGEWSEIPKDIEALDINKYLKIGIIQFWSHYRRWSEAFLFGCNANNFPLFGNLTFELRDCHRSSRIWLHEACSLPASLSLMETS